MRAALAMLLLAPAAVAAQSCGLPAIGARLESERFSVGLRTIPEKIQVAKHFTIELTVCHKPGVAALESVKVDAHMPEHRHGMNYAASVVPAPGNVYRAEGLLFHMPGRWEMLVDVRAQGRTDRLTRSLLIE